MLFAGAKDVGVIDGYKAQLGIKQFDSLIDWGWFWYITKPLFHVIDWINKIVKNFGVTILIVTVLVKLLFFPLANKSYESMAKMKKLQPEMEKIRERYKDDKARQQQEMMALYQKEKINPLAGCLPIFVQIPVFFALYKVLFVIARHAPRAVLRLDQGPLRARSDLAVQPVRPAADPGARAAICSATRSAPGRS